MRFFSPSYKQRILSIVSQAAGVRKEMAQSNILLRWRKAEGTVDSGGDYRLFSKLRQMARDIIVKTDKASFNTL